MYYVVCLIIAGPPGVVLPEGTQDPDIWVHLKFSKLVPFFHFIRFRVFDLILGMV